MGGGEIAGGCVCEVVTCAVPWIKARVRYAAPTSLSRPSPPVSSGKTESRRLEMEPGAVDGLDTLQDNTSSPHSAPQSLPVSPFWCPLEPLSVSSAHPAERPVFGQTP